FYRKNSLTANLSYSQNQTITLPANSGIGDRYLLFVTDSDKYQGETDDNNNVKAVPIKLSAPDLTIISATAPSAAISNQNINVSWTVKNHGTVPALADWTDEVYVSNDDKWDSSDVYISRSSESISTQTPLVPDGTYTISKNLQIPSNAIAGSRYLIFYADSRNSQGEIDENNNTFAIPISLSAPDLVISDVLAPATGTLGGKIDVTWTVTNQGTVEALANTSVSVYLSTNQFYDFYNSNFSDDVSLGSQAISSQIPLGTNESSTVIHTLDLNRLSFRDFPVNGYLIFVLDEFNAQGETNENNNIKIVPITLQIQDLVVNNVTVPTQAESGNTIKASWRVTNQGDAKITGNWVDRIYLSRDNNLSTSSDRLLGELNYSGILNGQESYLGELDVNLPIDVDGSYYIFIVTDANNQIIEKNYYRYYDILENNNAASSAIQIRFSPYVDLKVSDIIAPSLTIGNPAEVTIGWKVSNVGTITGTVNSWVDRIILSKDGIIGNVDDKILKEIPHTGLLAAGDSYSRSETILLPVNFEGRYQLFIQTDVNNVIFEGNSEANNTVSAPNFFDVVRIPYADLVVSSLTTPTTGSSGQPLSISWTVTNQSQANQGNGIATTNTNSWVDRVELTTDPEGKNVIADLGYFDHTGALGLDTSYTRSANVTIPNGITGTYYLVVTTTKFGEPFEFIYKNNNRRISQQLTVNLTPSPDLIVTDIIAPTAMQAGDKIDITWTVKNNGLGNAVGSWTDQLLLQEVGKTNTILLGSFNYNNALEAGKFYTRSEQLTLP
ncbi:MAG: CARDB domain-containing protein, partial [Microcystis panniformis]